MLAGHIGHWINSLDYVYILVGKENDYLKMGIKQEKRVLGIKWMMLAYMYVTVYYTTA